MLGQPSSLRPHWSQLPIILFVLAHLLAKKKVSKLKTRFRGMNIFCLWFAIIQAFLELKFDTIDFSRIRQEIQRLVHFAQSKWYIVFRHFDPALAC